MSLENTPNLRQRYPEFSTKLDALVKAHPEQQAWVDEFLTLFARTDTVIFRESDRFIRGVTKQLFSPDEVTNNKSYVASYKDFIKTCVIPETRRLYDTPGFLEAVCMALEEPEDKKRSFNFGSLTAFINAFHRKNFTTDFVKFFAENAVKNGFLGLYNIVDDIKEKPVLLNNPSIKEALRTSLWSDGNIEHITDALDTTTNQSLTESLRVATGRRPDKIH